MEYTAYLIKPDDKTVTEVEVDTGSDGTSIADIYKHIKCDCFDVVYLNEHRDCVYVNDNGLFDGTIAEYGMFVVEGSHHSVALAGYGLVVGTRKDESGIPTASLEELRAMVTFPDKADIMRRGRTGEFG